MTQEEGGVYLVKFISSEVELAQEDGAKSDRVVNNDISPGFLSTMKISFYIIVTALFAAQLAFMVIFITEKNVLDTNSTTATTTVSSKNILMTAEELNSRLQDDCLKIIDARFDKSMYKGGHIPGAVLFDPSGIFNEVEGSLCTPDVFEEKVQRLGINQNSDVVIYDSGVGSHGLLNSTRLWWVFKSFGVDSVSVLDGGYTGYAATHTISSTDTKVSTGGFRTADDFKTYSMSYGDFMLKSVSSQIIDARPTNQYSDNKWKVTLAKCGGHIQGSTDIPVQSLFDEHGGQYKTVKPLSTIESMFEEKGLTATKESIVYCNTGHQASGELFLLTMLNWKVKIFPGGWVVYSNQPGHCN